MQGLIQTLKNLSRTNKDESAESKSLRTKIEIQKQIFGNYHSAVALDINITLLSEEEPTENELKIKSNKCKILNTTSYIKSKHCLGLGKTNQFGFKKFIFGAKSDLYGHKICQKYVY